MAHLLTRTPPLVFAVLLAASCVASSQTVPECELDFDRIALATSPGGRPLAGRTTAKVQLTVSSDPSWASYDWCEVLRNRERLPLASWCRGRRIRFETLQALNDSTRTAPFVVSTGDTISFTRVFSLGARRGDSTAGPVQPLDAFDTLDFVVELLSASTLSRRALVDSVGVVRRVPPGPPMLYGRHPAASSISYVVGASLDGDTVVLRLRTDARGERERALRRYDALSHSLSSELSQPAWNNHNLSMGAPPSMVPESVTSRPPRADSSRAVMSIRHDGTGALVCEVTAPEHLYPVTLSLYDNAGRLLWSPAMWPIGIPGGRARVPLVFGLPAARMVVLSTGERILAAERVTER